MPQSSLAFDLSPLAQTGLTPGRAIVDQLIAERTPRLSRSPAWPLMKPVLHVLLRHRAACRLANTVGALPARAAFEEVSAMVGIDLRLTGLDHVPATGPVIIAANHPTGIADGIAVFDALKARRPDLVFFANRDALRVNPRFADMVIPVEWRAEARCHAKSRSTLATASAAIRDGRAIVVFPSGRLAHWHEGRLTERPWQPSFLSLARKHGLPVVPLGIASRNSGLYYLMSRIHAELRDMTLFNELLNKRGRRFDLHFAPALSPARLDGDPVRLAAALCRFTSMQLAVDPAARLDDAA